MEKIRVVIIEDEFVISEDIRSELVAHDYEVLGVFEKAEAALPFVLKNIPDLLLVDIMLAGDLSGVDLVSRVEEKINIPVIYITANSDQAIYSKAKETKPQAFLIKPFSNENLIKAIDLALYNFSAGHSPLEISREFAIPLEDEQVLLNQRLFVRSNGKFKKLNPDDLLFIEAAGSYVHLQTISGRFTLCQNLTHFYKKTPLNNLARTHRSYMVNLNRVDSFEESFVFIKDHKIPLSNHYKTEFMNKVHCL